MQETGYNIKNGGENNKYYIYNLLEEVSEDVLGEFDIKSILAKYLDTLLVTRYTEN